jgi:hypothetical protein
MYQSLIKNLTSDPILRPGPEEWGRLSQQEEQRQELLHADKLLLQSGHSSRQRYPVSYLILIKIIFLPLFNEIP